MKTALILCVLFGTLSQSSIADTHGTWQIPSFVCLRDDAYSSKDPAAVLNQIIVSGTPDGAPFVVKSGPGGNVAKSAWMKFGPNAPVPVRMKVDPFSDGVLLGWGLKQLPIPYADDFGVKLDLRYLTGAEVFGAHLYGNREYVTPGDGSYTCEVLNPIQ